MWHWAGEVQLVGKSNISSQAAKKSPALPPPPSHCRRALVLPEEGDGENRAGKEAGFLSPLAVFFEVWLEDVSALRTSLPSCHFPSAETGS